LIGMVLIRTNSASPTAKRTSAGRRVAPPARAAPGLCSAGGVSWNNPHHAQRGRVPRFRPRHRPEVRSYGRESSG
jgi:hypothetical protein